uniref:Uncharacterized protein n=1 Tax=Anopheles culicifacies TaxID=139723 RepID=A0A182MIM1_9DIPT
MSSVECDTGFVRTYGWEGSVQSNITANTVPMRVSSGWLGGCVGQSVSGYDGRVRLPDAAVSLQCTSTFRPLYDDYNNDDDDGGVRECTVLDYAVVDFSLEKRHFRYHDKYSFYKPERTEELITETQEEVCSPARCLSLPMVTFPMALTFYQRAHVPAEQRMYQGASDSISQCRPHPAAQSYPDERWLPVVATFTIAS